MVDKKILEALSDKELELYIKTESKYVSEAKIFAFEILKSRNYIFSKEQIDVRDSLIIEKKLYKETESKKKNESKIMLSPFIIVFGLFGLLLFFLTINFIFINNDGGNSLGALFTVIGLIIIFLVLSVEQQLLKHQNFKKENIWLLESLVILGLLIYFWINGFSIG